MSQNPSIQIVLEKQLTMNKTSYVYMGKHLAEFFI